MEEEKHPEKAEAQPVSEISAGTNTYVSADATEERTSNASKNEPDKSGTANAITYIHRRRQTDGQFSRQPTDFFG